jgi:hypothetical protein
VSPAGQVLNEFPIFIAPGGQVDVSAAFDGANYLVVWSDTRSGSPVGPDADIVGTRVTPAGVVLDPAGIAISSARGAQSSPYVSFDGTNYFVAWEDTRNDPGAFPPRLDIYGTRITPDGTVLDGPPATGGIAINTADVPKQHPVIAFDGTNYLVVWDEAFHYDPPTGIYAARVSTAGVLLDGPPEGPGILISQPSCFACRLVFPNIASSGDTVLLTWVINAEVVDTGKDVVGVSIATKSTSNFGAFDSNLFLIRGAKGDFFANGSFALGQASGTFDPTTRNVVLAFADEDGVFFAQTIPSGSFRKTRAGGYLFATANDGIRLMTIAAGDSPGHFRFVVAGARVNLTGADRRVVDVKLQVGNDSGTRTVNCQRLGALFICQ